MTHLEYPIDRIAEAGEGGARENKTTAPLRFFKSALDSYWALLAAVVLWQVWVTTKDVNVLVMPGPIDVARDIGASIPEYLQAVVPTLLSAIVGLIVGTAIGASLALLTQVWRVISGVVAPSLVILRSIPIVMLVPILSKVLSPGRASVYAITILIALFPAFVLVASAIASLPTAMDRVAVAFGSTKWRRLVYIHAPAAVPAVFTALKLSAALAVLAAIVAEFLTGGGGIGRVFILARSQLDTSRAWGIAIVGAIASVSLYLLAERLETEAKKRST